jgi:hypothetical protein
MHDCMKLNIFVEQCWDTNYHNLLIETLFSHESTIDANHNKPHQQL